MLSLQFSAISERNYCHGKLDFFAVISYSFFYVDILETPLLKGHYELAFVFKFSHYSKYNFLIVPILFHAISRTIHGSRKTMFSF